MERAQWVSVMADGSTDHSITEQENVYVQYLNEEGLLKTKLADIVPINLQMPLAYSLP